MCSFVEMARISLDEMKNVPCGCLSRHYERIQILRSPV